MDKIYAIMVMEDLKINEKMKIPEFGCSQVVGWYQSFENAYSSVTENCCDINERCYNYALIEEVYEGLYNPAVNRWWFKFDWTKEEYIEIKEPEFVKGTCGFTIL